MTSTAVSAPRPEYDARVAAGERLEFDRGAIIEIGIGDAEHEIIKSLLAKILIRQKPSDALVAVESGFELTPDLCRVPDLAIIEGRPRRSNEPLQGAPPLIVEIVSPSDKASDLERKVRLFLSHGSQAVWVIYPGSRCIRVHLQDGRILDFGAADVRTGLEPFPALKVRVADLFE